MNSRKDKKEGMVVAAICNGTVLDHISPSKLFKVAALLHLEEISSPITIGNNLESSYIGSKGIIKIADRFFSDDEINRIALIAPNVHLNIIKNYEVAEKRKVELPQEIVGIVRCSNPKCITNHEPMQTIFTTEGAEAELIRCHYCGRKIMRENIELK